MKRYAINGFLFSQIPTGVMRLAREILIEIDKKIQKGQLVLVIPEYTKNVPVFNNIDTIFYGKVKGNMREQISLLSFLRKEKIVCLNFNNTFPYFYNKNIVYIHDIAYKLHPEFGKSFHGRISNIYHKLLFRKASRKKFHIITVSHFSKQQLIDFYHVLSRNISVIGSAWQHINRIIPDFSIINRLNLEDNEFYFSLGSVSIMKNTKWIYEAAKNNPNKIFVVSGKMSSSGFNVDNNLNNLILTGFISDEEIKALMIKCKAFLYPSLYDGFGLPPLEALSQGCDVICSNAASLTEVYGSSVIYIDPYCSNVNIDELLRTKVADRNLVLDKYSWEKSASLLFNLLFLGDDSI